VHVPRLSVQALPASGENEDRTDRKVFQPISRRPAAPQILSALIARTRASAGFSARTRVARAISVEHFAFTAREKPFDANRTRLAAARTGNRSASNPLSLASHRLGKVSRPINGR